MLMQKGRRGIGGRQWFEGDGFSIALKLLMICWKTPIANKKRNVTTSDYAIGRKASAIGKWQHYCVC